MNRKWKSLSLVSSKTPWTIAQEVPLSMGFSRQETGVGSHSLLPTQGSNPSLLHRGQILYHISHQESQLKKKKKPGKIHSYGSFGRIFRKTLPQWKEWLVLSSVQLLSRVRLSATPWITACQASLTITNSRSSLKLMSIKSVTPSSHLSSVVPFSSCPQSLPPSESFPMSQPFAWGGQSTGVSALASKDD